MKPSWCTPTHGGLSDGTKSKMGSTWFGGSQCEKQNKGVYHIVALPFTLKSILMQKKNYGNPNISACKNTIFKKNHQKETKIFQDIITL
jgi:hypothetical protein